MSYAERIILALVLVVVITPAIARAQTPSDDERARMHFDAGRSYYEEGAYEQSLEEFTRAYNLSHRPAMLSNMANCEERLGRWAEAADHLAEYARTLPEDNPDRATLQRRIENLRARASRGDTIDTPGPQQPAPTPTSQPASDGLLIPSVVLMGAGGAALIAWGVLGGLALDEESRVAGECGATTSCTEDEVQTLANLALGADISMVLGLALVATGAILLIVDPPRGATNEVSVAPFVGPNTAGLVVGGRM